MSADPNLSKKPEDKSTKSAESVLPPDIFYNQMLLYDMFANNIVMFGALDLTRAVNEPSVYKLKDKEIDKVNNLAKISREKTKGFIEKITPLEIAQLVPKIEFSLVDAKEDKTIPINLVNPTDLDGYASGGYLQGGVVGLKSLNLRLEGNSKVAFAKHHIVEAVFVFDNINTFTSPIPNMGGLTYASVFRTQGRAVSEEQKYYRLTISHSGVDEVVQKYNLNDDVFSFTLNLTPMISTLSIKENLKTEVKMTFTSREENILSDRNLFDFIDLSLENSTKQRNAEFEKAKKAFTEAVEKKNEAKKKALKEFEEGDRVKRFKEGVDEAKAAIKAILDKYDGQEPREAGTGTEDNPIKTSEAVDRMRLVTLKTTVETVEKAINEKRAEISGKYDDELAKETEDYQEKKKLAQDRFANARAALIGKRLNEVIFQPGNDTGAIKEISMTVDQIRNYFDDRQAFEKSLNDIIKSAGNIKKFLGGGLIPNKEKEPNKDKPTKPTGEETEGNDAEKQKKIDAATAKRKAIQEEIDTNLNAQQAYEEAGMDADSKRLQTKIDELKKELAEIDNRITELNKTITTSEGELGNKDDLIKKYSDQNVIRYITFGDLMSLIMKFLISKTPKSDIKQEQALHEVLKKCRILTCKLNTPSQSGFRESEVYNIPISIAELELIFSKRLYGKSQSTFTIFELMQDIVKMTNNTRQIILSTFPSTSASGAKFGQYTVKIRTYSLIGDGPFEIMKKHKSKDYKVGFMLDVLRDSDGLGGGTSQKYKPVFYFGGPARGAQIKAEVSEFTSEKMQKAQFERISSKSNTYFVPAFFTNTITLFACPIFHLSMYYTLKAPTIKTDGSSGWLFIEGDYSVKSVTHSYSAGGTFTTKVEGMMAGNQNTPAAGQEGSTPAPPGTPTSPPTPPVDPSTP